MRFAAERAPYGQQPQSAIDPYMSYAFPASMHAASASTVASSSNQQPPAADRPKKAHKRRHRDKHGNSGSERNNHRVSKRQPVSSTSAIRLSTTAATQPLYATAEPFHHPFAPQRRSHHSSRGRASGSGEGSDVVMETNLDELFAPIPPLPDELADGITAGKQLSERQATHNGEEEKQEESRMDDATPQQPVAVVQAGYPTAAAEHTSAQPPSTPAASEERKELMSDTDPSHASDYRVREPNLARVLVQQAKDRESRYTTLLVHPRSSRPLL